MATGSQTGGMASGAASGAVTGFQVGGWWGAAAGAIIGGIGGYMSSDDGSNAQTQRLYSEYNAAQTREAGWANAAMQAKMANANASMIMQAAQTNTEIRGQVDLYNAQLKSFLGDYNASLLENDAALMWEASELDLLQMEQEFARQRGALEVGYGASGVMMNQDSPLTAIVDAQTQYELDVMIVRHNADLQASRLLDAAAQSRWEGNMAAASIMFEGKMANTQSYANSVLAATGTLVQGQVDSQMMSYNSTIASNQILHGGINAYQEYKSRDNQAMTNGLFQAGSTAVGGYMDNRTPTLKKTQTSGVPTTNVKPYAMKPASSYTPRQSLSRTAPAYQNTWQSQLI